MGLTLTVKGHVEFFMSKNSRIREFLTANFEEKNSKRNREFENCANSGSRICEDLVYRIFFPIPIFPEIFCKLIYQKKCTLCINIYA